MSDDPMATGGLDALVLDALLEIGVDADEAMASPFETRMVRLRAAEADSLLSAERADALRDAGVPL